MREKLNNFLFINPAHNNTHVHAMSKCFVGAIYTAVLIISALFITFMTYGATTNPLTYVQYNNNNNNPLNVSFGFTHYTTTDNTTYTYTDNMNSAPPGCKISFSFYIAGLVTLLPTLFAGLCSIFLVTTDDDVDIILYERILRRKLLLERIYIIIATLGTLIITTSLFIWSFNCVQQFADMIAKEKDAVINFTQYTDVYLTLWLFSILLVIFTLLVLLAHKQDRTLDMFRSMRRTLLGSPTTAINNV